MINADDDLEAEIDEALGAPPPEGMIDVRLQPASFPVIETPMGVELARNPERAAELAQRALATLTAQVPDLVADVARAKVEAAKALSVAKKNTIRELRVRIAAGESLETDELENVLTSEGLALMTKKATREAGVDLLMKLHDRRHKERLAGVRRAKKVQKLGPSSTTI